VRILSESEVLVMLVTLDVVRNGRIFRKDINNIEAEAWKRVEKEETEKLRLEYNYQIFYYKNMYYNITYIHFSVFI
jgi:hypothetical protein